MQPTCNLTKKGSVQPKKPVISELQSLISDIESGNYVKPKEVEKPSYEVYKHGRRYAPGTELLDPITGEVMIAPEVDGEGNAIPEYW